MKKSLVVLIVLILTLLVSVPSVVLAQGDNPPSGNTITGDQVVIGNTFRLESGDTLDGSMLIIGGTATTASDTKINGDLILIGGTLAIDGTVNGDIVSIGGAVNLSDSAIVNGNLSLLGANLQRSSGSIINGQIEEGSPNFPGEGATDQLRRWLPFGNWRNPVRGILTTLFEALALGILAVLVGLLMPHNVKNIAANLVREPLVSGGIGLLAIIVAPIILLLVAITIILIPVSFLAFIALGLALVLGFIAVGYEVGQRLATLFKTTWHPSISAGIGTLLLSLVTGIAGLIPCVGWVLGFIAAIIGLGAVITSRVGSERYANKLLQAVLPVTPAASPSTPTEPPVTDISGEPPASPEGQS